ncbi:hypothetical protein DERP_009843 [Dermatophagoides pteronyssinus]|uniref:Uncharacterized protein n=1 Tax=Dermatophagoides pteronyssinus TaxID=6956 RepID=A0ABQ8IRB0_DERPT|nr:hypothetical protein DERP_009843 [Dermatophagoides pteronyssinus]
MSPKQIIVMVITIIITSYKSPGISSSKKGSVDYFFSGGGRLSKQHKPPTFQKNDNYPSSSTTGQVKIQNSKKNSHISYIESILTSPSSSSFNKMASVLQTSLLWTTLLIQRHDMFQSFLKLHARNTII